jgi:hypothetical protein
MNERAGFWIERRGIDPARWQIRDARDLVWRGEAVMGASTGKSDRAAQVTDLIAGLQKHYPDASGTLRVDGTTYTVGALTQLMQDFVDRRAAVEAARANLVAKLQAERALSPATLDVVHALVAIVRGTFGKSADTLADFGLAPPRVRAPLTAEKKAAAAARRSATRALRGTMGKKQKKGIKANVSATVVVSPATAPVPSGEPPSGAAGPKAGP